MTRDYRLFGIQHAVLPTKLPLKKFYEELVKTQQVLNMKHLGFGVLRKTAGLATQLLLKGQTNFIRMLFKFNSIFNPERLLADHQKPLRYEMPPFQPNSMDAETARDCLYVLQPRRELTLKNRISMKGGALK